MEDLLIEWGATKCPLPPSPLEEEEEDSSSSSKKSRFDSSRLTHLITDTLDFPEYNNNSLFKGSNEVVGGGGSSSIKGKGKSTTAGGGEGGGLKGDDKIGDGKIKIVTVKLPSYYSLISLLSLEMKKQTTDNVCKLRG